MNRSRLAALSAGAMFLVASVFVPATALAAGSGTLTASASTLAPAVGSTFTVDVQTNSAVVASGASAAVTFDQTKLQIVSVTKGADWNVSGASWVAFPTTAVISQANATGTLPSVGVFLTAPQTVAANTTLNFFRITFFTSAAGASTIGLPVGPATGGILDGQATTYGDALTVTSTGASLNAAGTATLKSVITTVTGTVDSGFVGLTCPAAVTIPLIRNVNNAVDAKCTIQSNVTWQLSAVDQNADPATVGHMRDTTATPNKVLHDPFHVTSSVGAAYNHDLSNLVQSSVVASGQNNVDVNLTLTQFAQPNDQAGNYGIQVLFSANSVF